MTRKNTGGPGFARLRPGRRLSRLFGITLGIVLPVCAHGGLSADRPEPAGRPPGGIHYGAAGAAAGYFSCPERNRVRLWIVRINRSGSALDGGRRVGNCGTGSTPPRPAELSDADRSVHRQAPDASRAEPDCAPRTRLVPRAPAALCRHHDPAPEHQYRRGTDCHHGISDRQDRGYRQPLVFGPAIRGASGLVPGRGTWWT